MTTPKRDTWKKLGEDLAREWVDPSVPIDMRIIGQAALFLEYRARASEIFKNSHRKQAKAKGGK